MSNVILFKADISNTGPATLSANGMPPAPIRKGGGAASLASNDLTTGQWTLLVFDGAVWQMQGQVPASSGGGAGYSAGKGIDITGGTINAASLCVQTSQQAGDTRTSTGNFATTCTIPANTITAGTIVEIWAAGRTATGTSGSNQQFGLKLGSTALFGNAGPYVAANVTGGFVLQGRLICTAEGPAGAVEAQGNLSVSSTSSAAGGYSLNNANPISLDTTADQVLTVTGAIGTTGAGTSQVLRQLIVKVSK